MGEWLSLKKWLKKTDLRDACRQKYGEDFVKMYDMVNDGVPIGNLEETISFLAMVEAARRTATPTNICGWREDVRGC